MKYTVTSDYAATGEGHTMIIFYCLAADSESALNQFRTRVHGGDWYSQGAKVVQGFDFDCGIAQLLVTPAARAQLEDTGCNLNYLASIHYNYS